MSKTPTDDSVTLLGVRADGVAAVLDLTDAQDMVLIRARAHRLLAEHASCELVEVWRGSALLVQLGRA
jgi:hypothetical protein